MGDVEVPDAFDLEVPTFVLTYASDRGSFADTRDPAEVPARARGMVRVAFSDGRRAPAGRAFVTNIDVSSDGGSRRALETVPVELFEELALGRGLSSQVELPEGLEAPPPAPPAEDIIVYKTSWCGVCKKAMSYLDRKGVPYVARDVETDVGAAAELKTKADSAGVATGSVPIIDVRGTLMVGFDRARLEALL